MWDYGEMGLKSGGGGGGSSSCTEEEEEEVVVVKKPPAWLEGLLGETFFAGCGVHDNKRKKEKNIFCLDCCLSFCPHCLPSHPPHHSLLQVRRYVYQDVVRLDDLDKLIDCSFIQPYTINSAKVIFLKQRAQSKSGKANSGNACYTCDRILQDPFHFCSLSCKVDNMVYEGEDLSSILHAFQESDFTFSQQFESLHMDGGDGQELLDDGQITPNSILEAPLEYGCTSSTTTSSYNVVGGNPGISEKGSGFLPAGSSSTTPPPMFSLNNNNRRKSAPRRSPLC